jgi:Zn-finger nucleic acid-binding protein
MSTSDHLSGVQCPYCKVDLFRAQDPVSGEIVFCPECLAGGRYKQVVEERGGLIRPFMLIRPFITRESVDDFLRKIGPAGE